nr:hypothetical protein HUO10_003331 [Paraburkholderia busanensis]
MITYQLESFDEYYPEAQVLLANHWEEVALNKDVIKLDIDEAEYRALDRQGALQILTVRCDGALVGYKVHVVKGHLHYKSSLTAFSDVYYLSPEIRSKPRVPLRMFQRAEDELKRRGVQRIIETTKLHSNKQKFLEFQGYGPSELVLTKILKGD